MTLLSSLIFFFFFFAKIVHSTKPSSTANAIFCSVSHQPWRAMIQVQAKGFSMSSVSRFADSYLLQRKFVLRSISTICASEHIKKLLGAFGMSPLKPWCSLSLRIYVACNINKADFVVSACCNCKLFYSLSHVCVLSLSVHKSLKPLQTLNLIYFSIALNISNNQSLRSEKNNPYLQ